MGYARAGFEVVGVDHKPQPNYPFEFLRSDALGFLGAVLNRISWGDGPVNAFLGRFDAIHASPPCQRYAGITKVAGDQAEHPDLIAPTRELLIEVGLPYVIENVPDARRELIDPIYICGSMFDPPLDVRRHRYFEANWPLEPPTWPCRHKLWSMRYRSLDQRNKRGHSTVQVHGGGQHGPEPVLASVVGVHGSVNYAGEGEIRKKAMQIDWMTQKELNQAIPPAYCELIGEQLLRHLSAEQAA